MSPAELFQNRRLRSRLDLIKPDLQVRIEKKQYDQQAFANIHSHDRKFCVGEDVYVQTSTSGKKWITAKIKIFLESLNWKPQ